MGFLESFKYYLVVGRLFGFVFFSIENETENFIDLIWIVPFGIFYFYATIKGMMFLPAIFINKILRVGDFVLVSLGHLTLISRSVYYIIKKNRLRNLLKKLDDFDNRLELITVQNNGMKLQNFIFLFLIILIIDVITCVMRKLSFFLYFLYTSALCGLYLHECFINKILSHVLYQISVINKNIAKIIMENKNGIVENRNKMWLKLQKALELYWEFVDGTKEANDFFGLVLLIDINLSLTVLVVTVYFLKAAGANHDFPMAVRIHMWTIVTLTLLFWSTKLWTSIGIEVRPLYFYPNVYFSFNLIYYHQTSKHVLKINLRIL